MAGGFTATVVVFIGLLIIVPLPLLCPGLSATQPYLVPVLALVTCLLRAIGGYGGAAVLCLGSGCWWNWLLLSLLQSRERHVLVQQLSAAFPGAIVLLIACKVLGCSAVRSRSPDPLPDCCSSIVCSIACDDVRALL